MAKKKKPRIPHRVPANLPSNMEGRLDEQYLAEIEASMERGKKLFEKAKKAHASAERRRDKAIRNLAAAEERRESAKIRREAQARLRELEDLVEKRREELEYVERTMRQAPVPSRHKGRGQVRHVSKSQPGVALASAEDPKLIAYRKRLGER